MGTNTPPTCHIQQTACGRFSGEPVCSKCGIDERVRYTTEEAAQRAKAQATAKYWHFDESEVCDNEKGEKDLGNEAAASMFPSVALAKIVGSSELTRLEAVHKVLGYIERKHLKDAVEVRMVNSDGILLEIFGKKRVNLFQVPSLLGRHLTAQPVDQFEPTQKPLTDAAAWPFLTANQPTTETPPRRGWFSKLWG